MTLSFEFTDFFSISIIPRVVGSIFSVLFCIYLIKAGKNQQDEIQYAKLLIYAGIIHLIFEILSYIVPSVSISDFSSEMETLVYFGYKLFGILLFTIPSLFTTGLAFAVFGYKNREYFNKPYLLIAGVLWIILDVSNVITSFIFDLVNYLGVDMFTYLTISFFILNPSIGLMIAAIILFTLHGYKHDDKFLKYAGLVLILDFIVGFFLTIIVTMLPVLLYSY